MSSWIKLLGTTTGKFILGLAGVTLKNNAGDLVVRNNADSADAAVTASTFKASGDVGLVINSDAAGSGADWKATIQRPSAGMTADLTLTLPVDAGTVGQVLETDGAGNLSWATAGSNASSWKTTSTALAFGSGSTVSMVTLPANAIVSDVTVVVDTPFDGTPSLSIGTAGNASLYVGSGDNLLSVADDYTVLTKGIAASGSAVAIQAAYSAGGASVGAARLIVTYAVPN